MNETTSQDNSTNTEVETATVSIRCMEKSVWLEMAIYCKREGITIRQYITNLIKKDLNLASNE